MTEERNFPYLCQWNNSTNDDQPVCNIDPDYANAIAEILSLPEKISLPILQNMYVVFYPTEQTCINPSKWNKLKNTLDCLIPVEMQEIDDQDNTKYIFVGFLQLPHKVIDAECNIIPYLNRYNILEMSEFTEDGTFNFRCHITKNRYSYQEIYNNTYNFFNNKIRSYNQYYAFIGHMNKLNNKLDDNTRGDYAEQNRQTAISSPRLNMDNYNFSHGLTAFNNGDPWRNLYNIQDSIKNSYDWEICCSTPNKPIGLIGIYVKGEVIMASCTDIYTYVQDRIRVFDDTSRFTPAFSYTQLYKKHQGYYGENTNNEIILIPGEITGIWVKEYASTEAKQDAQNMAKQLNISLSVVSAWREE